MLADINNIRRSRKRRQKAKGRKAEGSFIGIPHQVLDSARFANLSGHATKLLLELARQYKGKNNGDFSAAFSQLRNRGWHSPGTLQRAKEELIAAGFVMLTRQGGRHRCSLYAVTWWAIDDCDGKHDEPATHAAPNLWRTAETVNRKSIDVDRIRMKRSVVQPRAVFGGPDLYESHRVC